MQQTPQQRVGKLFPRLASSLGGEDKANLADSTA